MNGETFVTLFATITLIFAMGYYYKLTKNGKHTTY